MKWVCVDDPKKNPTDAFGRLAGQRYTRVFPVADDVKPEDRQDIKAVLEGGARIVAVKPTAAPGRDIS